MALRSIHFWLRRLFLNRRRTCVVLAVLSFIGYFIFFATPDVRFSISVVEKTSSANVSHDCVCATTATIEDTVEDNIVKQTKALTPDRKLKHNSSTFFRRFSGGSLNVHMWSEICGMSVDTLRNWPHFPYFPDKRTFISEFRRTQRSNVQNSGERIFGFVHPQVSGTYKFAITSDDTSELWLSRNEDPASSKMIARVYSPHGSAWTEEGDYKKYPEQISEEILLHTGKKYYIESLSKQGSGAAHVAVYWSYRNSTFEIISSKYLSRFYDNHNEVSIPLHAGKQRNMTLRSKHNLYYFNRLPFISRKEYISVIPTCSYSPSFLLYGTIKANQGVWITMEHESRVFPQDDTNMLQIRRDGWSRPNLLLDDNTVESVVHKLITSLRTRLVQNNLFTI